MIITCDECNSSFSVGDSLIKESGSKVRCSKCDSVFVAYPQSTEDIEDLETAEDDLGLDDLDSDLGDFLDSDEGDDALAMSADGDESELDLNDFDDTLDATDGLELDDSAADTGDELELDLNFDQDDDSDLILDDQEAAGDDLPELADLEGLDDTEPSMDDGDMELEDLELDLESETDAELELDGEGNLDLTDLGLEEEELPVQEETSAEEVGALEVEESDELDLSDLEQSLDDDGSIEAAAGAGSDDLEFDLEVEDEGIPETAETDLEVEGADELELSDLDLELEDTSADGDDLAEVTEDLDLDLELESEPAAEGSDSDADELDLSDLSDIMEDEKAPAAEAQAEELDLGLELEDDGETAGDESEPAADTGDIDELDLSDLEGIMESEEASPAADDSAQELELQMDEDAPQAAAAADGQDSDELDFSDLEQMLESDETPTVENAGGNVSEELDLQFDLDEPAGPAADAAVAENTGAEEQNDQDDDFLDIEQLLEEGEDSSPLESIDADGDVTDLPLEMEAALDDASKGAEDELELDFDLESELQAKEDLFEADDTDNQLESNLLASDEVDFLEEAGVEETEFQDGGATSVISTDEFDSDEMTDTGDDYGETHVLPGGEGDLPIMEAEDEFTAAAAPAPKASRSKKPLLVIVLMFLLAIGVVIIPNMLGIKIPYISDIKIPYLSDIDVKIPYLSDWLNPQPQDVAGNLKIIPLGNTINGKFVNNSKAGQLFVIQGHIKNEYDHPRSYIKVTGRLYLKGKKMAKQATVYCGNMLSSSELASMDINSINKKLRTRSGDRKSNFKVSTGKRVPFMIVFDKLPGNLDEYTVEVEGSTI